MEHLSRQAVIKVNMVLPGKKLGNVKLAIGENIVSVAAGGCYTVGLKADGTVIARGYNYAGKCNVSGWRDIVAVAAGDALHGRLEIGRNGRRDGQE